MTVLRSPAIVLAAFLRHPLRLPDGRALYVLATGSGRFLSVSAPECFDAFGTPIPLHAELAPGSIVRVSLIAGHMRAIQVVHARYADPFRASS